MKQYRHLTENDRRKIKDYLRRGYTNNFLRKNFGYHHLTVKKVISKKNAAISIKAKAIEMIVSGEKLVYTAAYLGISKSSVYNWYNIYKGVKTGVTITLPSKV